MTTLYWFIYQWQISADITHKNLAVHKIMEAMRTVIRKTSDSVSTRLEWNITQTITEHKENVHCLWWTIYFTELFDELK